MREDNFSNERDLDGLFAEYRGACPDFEPGPNFMPELWARIEARRGFWPAFEHLARVVTGACAVACLVLLLLNVAAARRVPPAEPTYAEALVADQGAEAAYYSEVRVTNVSMEPVQ